MGNGQPAGSMRSIAVELRDALGDNINIVTEEGFEAFVSALEALELKLAIQRKCLEQESLNELKKISTQLSIITGTEINTDDLEG